MRPGGGGATSAVAAPSASLDVVSAASPYVAEPTQTLTPQGKVDGSELRRRFRKRMAEDRTPVTVLQGGSPRELGQRLCEQVVPKRAAETPILIKPNLGGFEWFKDPEKSGGDDGLVGRTTDPEFVRGIIHCLKARGHHRITVAEGWGARHADWLRLIKDSGYESMTHAEGVSLVAMDDDGVFDVQGGRPGQPLTVLGMNNTHVPTLLMPRVLAEHLESGLYISAPKVKAHRFAVASIGLKSVQGTVMLSDGSPAFRQKWRMHRELSAALKAGKDKDPEARKLYVESLRVFAERIADVLEVEAPHVVLAEGAPAMGGDGFSRFWPSAEMIAIGGTQLVWVDRVGLQLLGLWKNPRLARELLGHATSPLLEVASKRWGIDIQAPLVRGDGAALLDAPRPVHFLGMAGFAIHSSPEASTQPIRRIQPPSPGVSNAVLNVPDAGAGEQSGVAAPPGAANTPAKPELHAVRASRAPVLDGRPDDLVWQQAPKLRFDTDYSGKHTGVFTTVRASWDPQGIYLLWELESAGLNTDQSRSPSVEREKLYSEDCVEFFLTPDPQRPNWYWEIEAGPFGHYLDLSVDRDARRYDTGWSSQAEIGTHRDPATRVATVEMALRSNDILRVVKPGSRLPVGLFRMEGKRPRLYLAASPPRTAKPDFHQPAAFGNLIVDP